MSPTTAPAITDRSPAISRLSAFQMENGRRPAPRIRGRPPDDREPEGLVEAQRGLVLLVDVDRQPPTRHKTLRVCHEQSASSLPVMVRIDEQRLDRVACDSQKTDRRPLDGFEHPPVESVARQRPGNERA